MTKRTVPLVALLLLTPTVLLAQFPPNRPGPTPTIPSGPRVPTPGAGQFSPPDPCQDMMSQPLVTLSLSPAEIYREDSITLTWEVRDRRPQIQWAYPVRIETSGVQPPFPDPAPLRGSHTFTSAAMSGRVTLRTRCGDRSASWDRIPDAILRSLDPARGSVGSRVVLRGEQFGRERGSSRVEIVSGNQTRSMETRQWGEGSIEATVPNMPAGPALIRLVKGGRRPTTGIAFRVVKVIPFDSNLASQAVAGLGLAPGFLHLHNGANASSMTLSGTITGGGPLSVSFTVPDFSQRVPVGARIVQAVALPVGVAETVRFRVTNVNSNSLSGSVEDGRLVFTATFEGQGRELKGDLRFCWGPPPICVDPRWEDGMVPDLQIRNMRVTLRLTPAVAGGALSFPSAEDSFDGDVQLGSDLENWLIPPLQTYAGVLKSAIRAAVHSSLNTARVRGAIATIAMARIRAVDPSFQQILSVTPSGAAIVVEYE